MSARGSIERLPAWPLHAAGHFTRMNAFGASAAIIFAGAVEIDAARQPITIARFISYNTATLMPGPMMVFAHFRHYGAWTRAAHTLSSISTPASFILRIRADASFIAYRASVALTFAMARHFMLGRSIESAEKSH